MSPAGTRHSHKRFTLRAKLHAMTLGKRLESCRIRTAQLRQLSKELLHTRWSCGPRDLQDPGAGIVQAVPYAS